MEASDFRSDSYASWQQVAESWEGHGQRLWLASEHVSRNLVERLALSPGATVLELAAGSGQTSVLLAHVVGSGGRVIASDFVPAMVEAQRRLGEQAGVDNVEYRVIDAEQIDLRDGSLDGVLCRWGLMLVADPARALAEIRRVLRPGSPLAFAVWASPDANPWAAVVGRTLVAIGAVPPPDPAAPGAFSLATTERIEELVRGAGFGDPEIEDVPLTWEYESFDDFWTVTLELAAGLRKTISAMTAEEQRAARAAVEQAAEPYRVDGAYAFPALSRNVVAR